jgi:hypothetical protein
MQSLGLTALVASDFPASYGGFLVALYRRPRRLSD